MIITQLDYSSAFQRVFSVNVWCGIFDDGIYGPHLFEGHLNGKMYLNFLGNALFEVVNLPMH